MARARGELLGVGVSTFVEPSSGVGFFESGTVRVERTGEITVLTTGEAKDTEATVKELRGFVGL